jgi:hypothetical protein
MPVQRVAVRDLQAGDVLSPTNRTVIAVRQRAHIPNHKREVVLEDKGKQYASIWGASTQVTIIERKP